MTLYNVYMKQTIFFGLYPENDIFKEVYKLRPQIKFYCVHKNKTKLEARMSYSRRSDHQETLWLVEVPHVSVMFYNVGQVSITFQIPYL